MRGQEPCFPAQLDARHHGELGAGDQGVDLNVGLDVVQRFALVDKRTNFVMTGLEQA